MTETFFVKRGRRYIPVHYYDSELCDSLSEGYHLVHVYKGGRYTKFNINPNHAAVLSTVRSVRSSLENAVVEASAKRPFNTKISDQEQKAWEVFKKSTKSTLFTLALPSARDIIDALERELINHLEDTNAKSIQ